jgi:hypothetical protein
MLKMPASSMRAVALGLTLTLLACVAAAPGQDHAAQPLTVPAYCQNAEPATLPLPHTLPLSDYEQPLYAFLFERRYRTLGWCVDKGVRDTGPYIEGLYYGTHPAVRIYYSPEVMRWLVSGRVGEIPDGAMIVKEMFAPPAARYRELRAKIEGQHPSDAAQADKIFQGSLDASLLAWTVLVKDKLVSKDGWFWAGPAPGSIPDNYDYPFNFPASGAGLGTCLRCHASAKSEVTFASLRNIKGFEALGDPVRFRVDDSWRSNLPALLRPATEPELAANLYRHLPEAQTAQQVPSVTALSSPNPAFVATFPPIAREGISLLQASADKIQSFPGQWADRVAAGPGGAEHFITSDNCLGCHGGLAGPPYPITMFVKTGPNYGDGYNVSEYGEWRWSPMGLAGRDPIFFAQLESELALLAADAERGLFPQRELRTYQQAVANTCLSCHGAMGQRQLAIDWRNAKPGIEDPNFYYPDYVVLSDPLTTAQEQRQKSTMVDGLTAKHSVYPYHRYGNLAREGISCTVCHHIDPPSQWTDHMTDNQKLAAFLLNSTTGVFPYSPRDELNGPFADIKTRPMEHSLGIKPQHNAYIRDSKLCGTCHAINLPNVDVEVPPDRSWDGLDPVDREVLNQAAANGAAAPNAVPLADKLTAFQHSIEQATYLEWENSAFAWDPSSLRSCQDCHMPGGLHTVDGKVAIEQLSTRIATIQDSTYPDVENALPDADTGIPLRDDYRRHELVGLNAFLLEMFNQFDRILGVDRSDYMTSATNGNRLAVENMLRQAREDTVALEVGISAYAPGALEATVEVTNKVGHRFPSGVGFRRAFLELLVVREIAGRDEIVWGSGRTNSVGVIVDGNGAPLRTEFLDHPDPASQAGIPLYQKHHDVITSQDQVQIYEELVLDADNRFTTSFVHRAAHPKDNRLLPFGSIDPVEDPKAFQARFGADETIRAFMKATRPEGSAENDTNFAPGTDTVTYKIALPEGLDPRHLKVKATMYYQTIPPYWLKQRFTSAPDQPGTQRLYYLTSHLNTAGTPIESWKLPLVTASAYVVPRQARAASEEHRPRSVDR